MLWLAALAALAVDLNVTPASACSVCFGDKNSPLTQGAVSGILFMVLLTYLLLIGVGGFVTFWAIRARRIRNGALPRAHD